MKVLGLFSAKKGEKTKVRPSKSALELVKGHGIVDDKFAGKNLQRSVMIVPVEAYKILEDKNIKLEYGSLGENILVDFDIMQYPLNTTFKIGSALLKITEKCTICTHLAYFDDKVPDLVKDHRGVYCEILADGILYNSMDIIEIGEL